MLTLGDLHIGQDAIIRVVGGEGELRHHLLDMGLTPGTEVTLRKTAPMGDPIEVELRGYELTLRLADAQKIEIDSVHATDRAAPSEERHKVVATPDSSLLALVGSLITPIFKPLGFGDWRISTALITGFTAKESVVSTLTVLLGGDTGALNMLFTPFTALVFLIFTLLYTPCVAAIAAVKRELGGGRAALGVVLMQCGIAWVVAFAVHCVGVLLGVA